MNSRYLEFTSAEGPHKRYALTKRGRTLVDKLVKENAPLHKIAHTLAIGAIAVRRMLLLHGIQTKHLHKCETLTRAGYICVQGRGYFLTQKGRTKLKELFAANHNVTDIAKKFDISLRTTEKFLKESGLVTKRVNNYETLARAGYIHVHGQAYLLTQKGRRKLQELVADGHTGIEIAKTFAVSQKVVAKFLDELGLVTKYTAIAARRANREITRAEEDQILEWTVQGWSNSQMAEALDIAMYKIKDFRVDKKFRIHGTFFKKLHDTQPQELTILKAADIRRAITQIEGLWKHKRIPTVNLIKKSLGFSRAQAYILKGLWMNIYGRGTHEVTKGPSPIENPLEIRDYVAPELHYLPFTYLDKKSANKYPAPSLKVIRYLVAILDQEIRNIMFIYCCTHISGYSNPHTFYSTTSSFTRTLLQIKSALPKGQRLCDVDAEPLLLKIYKKELDAGLTPYYQKTFINIWRMVANRGADYLERLGPDQREAVGKWVLPNITNARRLKSLRWQKHLKDDQQSRRKALTDVVHSKFYEARFAVGVRLNMVRRLYHAFEEACERGKKSGEFPVRAEYMETCIDVDGRQVNQIVSFEVWDTNLLTTRGELKISMLSRSDKRFYLCFRDIRPINADDRIIVPWWKELFESRLFSFAIDAKLAQEQFNQKWGYGAGTKWVMRIGLDWSSPVWQAAQHLLMQGVLLVPITWIYRITLYAAFVIQIITKTGLRIGEVQQIAASEKCLVEFKNIGPNRQTRYAVRVIPKGWTQREEKFIDEEIWKLIIEIVKYIRHTTGSKKVPIVAPCYAGGKLMPERYLLQVDKSIVRTDVLNLWLRIALHPIFFDSTSGKMLHLVSHLFRHAYATELEALDVPTNIVSKILSHKDTRATNYYSQPTKSQIRNAVEKIFVTRLQAGRHGIRTPEEIESLLKEADGKIGALSEVLGGTCTVANLCPAKFACIGCAGNAPDPRKRQQVVEKRAWAEKQLLWAQNQKLTAEARQFEQHIRDCDDMLKEMSLIELAQKDSASEVNLTYKKEDQ